MKGKFITLEGCEGVGKSYQLQQLKQYFIKNDIDFIFTREPGGVPIAESIRDIILSKNNSEMNFECEALLYAAARVQHVKQLILPALESGKIVVCDRYIHSSLAYQGYARGLGVDYVKQINSWIVENAMPDLTLFLNLDPVSAFKRKGGVDSGDRVELSGLDFHKRVYEGYVQLAKQEPNRIVSIDASGVREQTHARIIQALKANGIIGDK